ncbi:low molecular weight protein-tyrosine-phosphatase [Jeotgalibacillus aurantiacus]|uniref:low molecular weight protein-tyrosine-phosphatase n=1 Tax=Jeotgalibacillus aurantiacus TaxID=2763266 RepID=UPI001D0B8DFD|nr:low molecular weight protein-tyrosine-phosphatase [Jeotgalibacillus aurantiacus]
MKRVLFVCLGNICRSPLAEAVMRQKVADHGLADKIEVASAGTAGWHQGNPPHEGTIRVLKENSIPHEGLTSNQLTRHDLEHYDYIVALDRSVSEDLNKLSRATQKNPKYILLLELIDAGTLDVPDPYYTNNFQESYDLINRGCDALIEKIKDDHGGD